MTEKKTPAIAVPITYYHRRPEPTILPHELQGRILDVLSQPGQHSNETLAGLLKEVIELSGAEKQAASVVTVSAEGGRTVSGPECSFCGKNHSEVRKLIGGQGGSICNECVALCNELMAEDE